MTGIAVTWAEPGSDEWLKERLNGIGASEAPALLGLNPWMTAADVWLDKTGKGDFTGNYATRRGTHMESFVLGEFATRHDGFINRPVVDFPSILAHPGHGVVRASLDGLVESRDETAVVECKTSKRSWGGEGPPAHYVAQVQWQLMVTGLSAGWLIGDIAGDYLEYRVDAQPRWQESALATVLSWWQRHIVDGVVPDLDAARDAAKLPRLFDADPTVAAVTLADDAVTRLRVTRERLAHARAEALEAEAAVKIAMGPATTAVDEYGFPVASWTATKPRTTIDTDALRGDGLYDKYTRVGQPSRRFTVNNNSEGDRG